MRTKLLADYENKWVALTLDRKKVIASANDIKTLDRKVSKLLKNKDVIYHHVLPLNGSYAP